MQHAHGAIKLTVKAPFLPVRQRVCIDCIFRCGVFRKEDETLVLVE